MFTTTADTIEPNLSYARERLGADPEQAHAAVKACRSLLGLLSTPDYVNYDPRAVLHAQEKHLVDDTHTMELEPVAKCVGVPEQIAACVSALAKGAVLREDAILCTELFEEDDVPRIALTIDGPGQFADPVVLWGSARLPFDLLCERWTAATRGGRIDETTGGLVLRLKGQREVPAAEDVPEDLTAAVRGAEQRLRLLVAGEGDAASAREAIDGALAVVDADTRGREPADLTAVVSESVDEHREALKARAIAIETYCDTHIPPIAMHRKRIRTAIASALNHTAAVLPRGGAVAILVDYDAKERLAGFVVTVGGTQCDTTETCYVAAMRRAFVDIHGGSFTMAPEKPGVTFTMALPDPVGCELDTWLPGFDLFSDRSCQMLRLLKSGGPTPPEELIFTGVLEEELDRWLSPLLSAPAVVNIAHDLKADNDDLAGSSSERLQKALTQLKRGKPRKELCSPPYAAEILWAFRAEERHRRAVGTELFDEDGLRAFCTGLLKTPPDSLACLRLLAASQSIQ
jgi:hypothetical protein